MTIRGFRRDRWGFRAYVKVGGVQRHKRFPPDTLPKTIQAWREEVRVALRKRLPPPAKTGGL